ncbi:hypothetical protein OE165_27605, partial [Escherichia coli]|uniref:hypothetical protein n=1 Tax=Escherichia coli TaxID=562 RepID=UPI0021F37B4D
CGVCRKEERRRASDRRVCGQLRTADVDRGRGFSALVVNADAGVEKFPGVGMSRAVADEFDAARLQGLGLLRGHHLEAADCQSRAAG